MIFPGCEANTDVTCLQMIVKKEVTAQNRGGGGRAVFAAGKFRFVYLNTQSLADFVDKICRIARQVLIAALRMPEY